VGPSNGRPKTHDTPVSETGCGQEKKKLGTESGNGGWKGESQTSVGKKQARGIPGCFGKGRREVEGGVWTKQFRNSQGGMGGNK